MVILEWSTSKQPKIFLFRFQSESDIYDNLSFVYGIRIAMQVIYLFSSLASNRIWVEFNPFHVSHTMNY